MLTRQMSPTPWYTKWNANRTKLGIYNNLMRLRIDTTAGLTCKLDTMGPHPDIHASGSLWKLIVGGVASYSANASDIRITESGKSIEIAGLGDTGWEVHARIDYSQPGFLLMSITGQNIENPEPHHYVTVFIPFIQSAYSKHAPSGLILPSAMSGPVPPAYTEYPEVTRRYDGDQAPMQLAGVYNTMGGVYVMSNDTTGVPKDVYVHRSSNGQCTIGVGSKHMVDDGKTFSTPWFMLGLFRGPIPAMVQAYRDNTNEFGFVRNQRLSKCWFMRHDSVFPASWAGGTVSTHMYVTNAFAGSYDFANGLNADTNLLGKPDIYHMYGWGAKYNGTLGNILESNRTGDYDPWNETHANQLRNVKSNLVPQIEWLKRQDVLVSAYTEGRLISSHSTMWKTINPDLEVEYKTEPGKETWLEDEPAGRSVMRLASGLYKAYYGHPPDNPYIWEHYQCLHPTSGWPEHYARKLAEILENVPVDVLYLDQIGMSKTTSGEEFWCINSEHPHDIGGVSNVEAQHKFLEIVRSAAGPDIILITEEMIPDCSARFVDGMLTYFVYRCDTNSEPEPWVNLYRFSLPHLKLFEIISDSFVAMPTVTNHEKRIRYTYWNGEGLYVWGPPITNNMGGNPPTGFTTELAAKLKAMFAVQREYSGCFASTRVRPLVPAVTSRIKYPNLYVNEFPGETETVWTVINTGGTNVVSERCLYFASASDGNMQYSVLDDNFAETDVSVLHNGGVDYLTVSIPAEKVITVIRRRP